MDRITVQPKYLAEYDAPITATILIAANDFPRLDLGDPALADRLPHRTLLPQATKGKPQDSRSGQE